MPIVDDALIARIFREESGRSVASLIRIFGDIDLAEDAVQEASALALQKWPVGGVPPNPGGWITTTTRGTLLTGLSTAQCWRIRTGRAVPHVRWWEALCAALLRAREGDAAAIKGSSPFRVQ